MTSDHKAAASFGEGRGRWSYDKVIVEYVVGAVKRTLSGLD